MSKIKKLSVKIYYMKAKLLPTVYLEYHIAMLAKYHTSCDLSKEWILEVNPLTTNAKNCSDLAEIFRVGTFIYLKNIIFYALIFYLALLKSY